jgi:hypothetical protein
MGWGFNQNNYQTTVDVAEGGSEIQTWTPVIANNQISNNQLRTEPFFRKPTGSQTGSQLFGLTIDSAYVSSVKDDLLSRALPALTTATGGWLGENIQRDRKFGLFVNMDDPSNKNGWPSNRGLDKDWKHSDIKDVGYVFSKEIFKQIVENGGL